MRIGAEQAFIVLDNDEFAVADQSASAVDHLTRSRSNDCLAFFTADVYAVSGAVIGFISTGNLPGRGPLPFGWSSAGT